MVYEIHEHSRLSIDDSLILSQSLSKYSNLKAGQINHRSWELLCKVLGLLVPLLELNRFGILLGKLEERWVVSRVIGGILSIEARDMDTKLLSDPESNNTLARCWFRRNIHVTTFESWHDKLLTLVAGCFKWLAVRVNIFLYLVKCRSLEDGQSYKEI
nr:hypothetical protein [Tanacetum cinerariifolium]